MNPTIVIAKPSSAPTVTENQEIRDVLLCKKKTSGVCHSFIPQNHKSQLKNGRVSD